MSVVKGWPLDLHPLDRSKQLQDDQPGEPATEKREIAKNKMADPKNYKNFKKKVYSHVIPQIEGNDDQNSNLINKYKSKLFTGPN